MPNLYSMKYLIFIFLFSFTSCHVHYHITPKEHKYIEIDVADAAYKMPFNISPKYNFTPTPFSTSGCGVPGCCVLHGEGAGFLWNSVTVPTFLDSTKLTLNKKL